MPPPDGPSSAVSEPSGTIDGDVVERRVLAEALGDVTGLDGHGQILPCRRCSSVISRSTATASSASTTAAAYAPVRSKRLEAILDVERHRLRAARDLAGYDRHGAVLAQRARRGEDHAVRQAPADRRQRDPPERLPAAGAERARRLLLVGALLRSTGSTSRTTNGSETKIVASTMPGVEKITSVEPNQPSRPQTSTSARPTTTGETANGRSISDVQQPLAAEVVAREHPGGQHAEDGVERHGDQRHQDREVERVLGLGRRHGLPGGAEAVLERAVEHHPHRHDEQRREVAERDDAQADAAVIASTVRRAEERDAEQHGERHREQEHRDGGGAGGVAALDLRVDAAPTRPPCGTAGCR